MDSITWAIIAAVLLFVFHVGVGNATGKEMFKVILGIILFSIVAALMFGGGSNGSSQGEYREGGCGKHNERC
tara:strand:+ start:4236 stop:4451 length:216 start_codon:yes stop_codon:yes gene_type:complete